MKKLLVVLAMGLFSVHAQATLITVNGMDYDVSIFEGKYKDNVALLQSQAWWGDGTLASAFADTLGSALGTPNIFGTLGPYFAYGTTTQLFTTRVDVKWDGGGNGSGLACCTPTTKGKRWYAIAEKVPVAVPAPATLALLGLGLGLLGLSLARRRRI